MFKIIPGADAARGRFRMLLTKEFVVLGIKLQFWMVLFGASIALFLVYLWLTSPGRDPR